MRNTRRPAWPVVFFLAASLGWGGPSADLRPLEELSAEIARWRRIRTPENVEALLAYDQTYLDQTKRWTDRWPEEELAWRERLRALSSAPAMPREANEALGGAARALGGRPGLRFPEDTRFWMARAAVRHGVRLDEVPGWLDDAVREAQETLPEDDHPLVGAYRREALSEARWRTAQILAELAYRQRDETSLAAQVRELTAESTVAVPDPADRIAVAERARRRMGVFLWRARLARLRGARAEAAMRYRQALEARPLTPGGPEPPDNLVLIEEAERYGVPQPAGGGAPVPPAMSAGPHWLPTLQRLEDFRPDGRPAVAVVWDGLDANLARAVERLERRGTVRIVSLAGAGADWIRRMNPLYTAAQIWIMDAAGMVRLVGRFQPGGDGWEDAVTGAAQRALSLNP